MFSYSLVQIYVISSNSVFFLFRVLSSVSKFFAFLHLICIVCLAGSITKTTCESEERVLLFWLGYAICSTTVTIKWKPPNSVTVLKIFDAITAQDHFQTAWYISSQQFLFFSFFLSYQFHSFHSGN